MARSDQQSLLAGALLNGGLVRAEISEAIQTAAETLSVDAAPTVEITVVDPGKDLIHTDVFQQRSSLRIGSRNYTLVQTDKQADRVVRLTFEQTEVYKLRQVTAYRKAYRASITRLTFCESMCREASVKFHAPEAGPGAPAFEPASTVGTPATSNAFDANAKITGKHVPLSARQKLTVEKMLTVVFGRTKNERLAQAVVMAATQESTTKQAGPFDQFAGIPDEFRASAKFYLSPETAATLPAGGHYGLFQQSPKWYKGISWFDITAATNAFLDRFMPKFNASPNADLGVLIESVQNAGLGPGPYDQWRDEAALTVASFSHPGRSRIPLTRDKFEFSRGQTARPETTWDALARLASEIGWRRFMIGDTVWMVSDEWLFASPSQATLSEDADGVEAITWTIDAGKSLDQATVAVDDSWLYSAGVTVTLENEGPANGKWLVSSWQRDLLAPTGTLTLVKPGATVPEPVGAQTGKGYKPSTDPSFGATKTAEEQTRGLPTREKIVAYARWGVQNREQIHYRQSRPIDHLAAPWQLPITTDCSGFVTLAYKAAGAPDPNGLAYNGQGFTGTELRHLATIPRSAARAGDLVVFGTYPGEHVVVITESGDDPLVASHGSEAGPIELRLSAEATAHPLAPMTFLAAGTG